MGRPVRGASEEGAEEEVGPGLLARTKEGNSVIAPLWGFMTALRLRSGQSGIPPIPLRGMNGAPGCGEQEGCADHGGPPQRLDVVRGSPSAIQSFRPTDFTPAFGRAESGECPTTGAADGYPKQFGRCKLQLQ